MAAGVIANMGLNLVVIPIAGMMGAAVVTIVSELIVLGLLVWWTRDVWTALPAAIRTAAIPTLALALVVWPIRDSLVAIPAGIAAYGIAGVLTGAIPIASLLDKVRTEMQQ